VAGTAGLLLAGVLGCCLGPRISRIRFPGGDGISPLEFFLAPLAFLSGVIGACGGGAPVVELVYRRCSPAARRPEREVSALGFCLVNREAALGLVEARRMEQIQSSRARLRSASVDLHPGSSELGACPRSMDLQRWLHLVNFDEHLLRLFQKLQSDGAPADLGLEASVLEDRRRWQTAAVSGVQRSQGHGCIFNFFKGLCANCLRVQLSSIFF